MANPLPQSFFGMTVNTLSNANTVTSPFGGLRMWDAIVTWKDIETSQGVFNWVLLDQWVAQAQTTGKDVLYTFGKIPTWAGGGAKFSQPPTDVDSGNANFKGFVTALVTRYAGRIAFYELWNEPNLNSTNTPSFPEWDGTAAQLLTMSQDAATIIRSIDPVAKIVSPSGSGGTAVNSFIISYLTACAGIFPFDIFAYHAYLGNGQRNASAMATILNDIKVKKNTFGIAALPTWFTEGSWGNITTYVPQLSDDEQVAYESQQYLFMANSNVARYYWYAWDNTSGFGQLWDSTNGVHPAGTAYVVLNAWLVGATITTALAQDGNGTWSMSLTLRDGEPAKIVWNASGSFPVSTTFASLYNLDGSTSPIVGGTVTASNKPILLSGNLAGALMAGKANNNSIGFLELLFQAVITGPYATLALNATTSPATQLFVSLHTADPGAGGTQTTTEAAYAGYARVAVARTSGGWSIAGQTISNVGAVSFPACTGGSETESFFGIGLSASGAGTLLYSGALTAGLAVSNGITPSFAAGALTITES